MQLFKSNALCLQVLQSKMRAAGLALDCGNMVFLNRLTDLYILSILMCLTTCDRFTGNAREMCHASLVHHDQWKSYGYGKETPRHIENKSIE
jgi:hypothetical protein